MHIFEIIRRNEFAGHVISLLTGAGIAQLITLIISPFLTRLYTPGDFGQFYVFVVIASLYAIFKTASLEKAVIISNTKKETSSLISFSILLIIASDVVLLIVYPLINHFSTLLINQTIPFSYFLFFLIYSSIFSGTKLFQALCNRQKHFRILAISNIIKALLMAIVQLLLGLLGFGYKGLIFGGIVGLAFGIIFIFFINKGFLKTLTLNPLLYLTFPVKKFKTFFFYETPSALINEFSVQLPLLAFKSFFGQTFAGYYSLPQRVLGQPMQLLGKSVSEVFFRSVSDMEENKTSQERLAFQTFKTLFLIGLLPFTLITIFGEQIFCYVFGNNWVESGLIASVLAPWMLFVFAGSPISSIFITKKKLKISFLLNILLFILRSLSIVAGIVIFNDFFLTALLFGMVSLGYWVFISVYSLHLCGVSSYRSVFFLLKWMIIPVVIFLIFKIIYG